MHNVDKWCAIRIVIALPDGCNLGMSATDFFFGQRSIDERFVKD